MWGGGGLIAGEESTVSVERCMIEMNCRNTAGLCHFYHLVGVIIKASPGSTGRMQFNLIKLLNSDSSH